MASITPYVGKLKKQLQTREGGDSPWSTALIEEACGRTGHRWRACFWTPAVTVLTFLRQVLHGNCSCRQAVAMTLAQAVGQELGQGGDESDSMSGEPGAYSQARHHLPRRMLEEVNESVTAKLRQEVGPERLWCGRRVAVVDGSSVSTPDTSELQKAFPQPKGQRKECGFPVIRLVALFCWSSGALWKLLADSLHVSELAMFRRLYDGLERGTVVLGDRYFGSYYDLILLTQRGLDGVFRMHQRRPTDLRRGQRLGPQDHLVTWTKPKPPPRGVTSKQWSSVPETLTVRHVRVVVDIAGFRSRCIDLVTTLLDPQTYPAAKLAELYRDRWMVELNLRSLKTTLKMETLRCKSVEMVRKELLMYQLAYNLVRWLMWQAARTHGCDPRRLSFAGTQQRILAVWPYWNRCHTVSQRKHLAAWLVEQIAADALPDRPNRIEPRCVKRRPKNYRRLTCSRAEARRRAYGAAS